MDRPGCTIQISNSIRDNSDPFAPPFFRVEIHGGTPDPLKLVVTPGELEVTLSGVLRTLADMLPSAWKR